MAWLAMWKAKKLEQKGSGEEESVIESVIDLKREEDRGRDTQGLCSVVCQLIAQCDTGTEKKTK